MLLLHPGNAGQPLKLLFELTASSRKWVAGSVQIPRNQPAIDGVNCGTSSLTQVLLFGFTRICNPQSVTHSLKNTSHHIRQTVKRVYDFRTSFNAHKINQPLRLTERAARFITRLQIGMVQVA
jgi:hypothetical protein